MSNLPVISKLLQDNPDLLTTEGLSALLHDCICLKYAQHHRFTYPSLLADNSIYLELAQMGSSNVEDETLIRRILASSKIWTANGCESQEEAADFLVLFRKIRDNIHQLQQNLGISGISQRNIAQRDRLFSYPAAEDQLILLECDACGNVKDERATLQNAVPEIIKYFLQIVQMSPAYKLFLVDEDENKIPTTVAAVENAVTQAVIADIYSESYHWELTGANSWHGKHAYKVDPDEIHLCLHLDWDDNEFIYIDADHSDPQRWPWLIDN
ncbi:hypothetical protein H6G90_28510 [Nostoc sp. FACHB-145]|nr:hypothetical protein [Nostoc sp. FACHB-145]